jgi:hypothetical protein
VVLVDIALLPTVVLVDLVPAAVEGVVVLCAAAALDVEVVSVLGSVLLPQPAAASNIAEQPSAPAC